MGSEARVDKTNGYERTVARDAQKHANARMAAEAADRRQARVGSSIGRKVEAAGQVLHKRSVMETINIIENVAPLHRDPYIIAETVGANRRAVLVRFGNPRKEVLARYLDEVGKSPNQE
jgi:hypothetical protein